MCCVHAGQSHSFSGQHHADGRRNSLLAPYICQYLPFLCINADHLQPGARLPALANDTSGYVYATVCQYHPLEMSNPRAHQCLAVVASLLVSHARHPVIVLINSTAEVEPAYQAVLTALGAEIHRFEQVPLPPIAYKNLTAKALAQQTAVINKMNLWLLPYKKVLYLDADAVAVQNMDHLFAMDSGGACENLPHPYLSEKQHDYIDRYWVNAGVLLLKPNKTDFDRVVAYMNAETEWKHSLLEQELINTVLKPPCLPGNAQIFPDMCGNPADQRRSFPFRRFLVLHYAWMEGKGPDMQELTYKYGYTRCWRFFGDVYRFFVTHAMHPHLLHADDMERRLQ